jgi:hypothetical protein
LARWIGVQRRGLRRARIGRVEHDKGVGRDHRTVAVVLVGVIGAGFHGLVLGRWQWRILVTRMPGLPRRQWVIATLALVVSLFAIAPGAVDILAQGGDTLAAFKNDFI